MPLYFFFFNDTATTEIYTLSLHDALPISRASRLCLAVQQGVAGERLSLGHIVLVEAIGMRRLRAGRERVEQAHLRDRKSTRLNSSHANISYAGFCFKKTKRPLTIDRRSVG